MPHKIIALPSKRVKDITGQKFGHLTVVSFAHVNKRKRAAWTCSCSCGNTIIVQSRSLISGGTKGCSCGRGRLKHGHAKNECCSVEYRCWINMKTRCYNKKAPEFKNYGGRGITVCKEWRDSFLAFYSHVGPKPSPELTLDRIDNGSGYRPGNVRWATPREQSFNRRRKLGTHCSRGHKFTKENTRIQRTHYGTARVCRTCNRDQVQEWRRKQKTKEI